MIRPDINPLSRDCLTDHGIQGVDAKAPCACAVKDIPTTESAVTLALTATDAARSQLDRYAMATDCPAWEIVEAADLLAAARYLLAKGGKA